MSNSCSYSFQTLQLFVYLFGPLCYQLRSTDFNNFRLENGYRIWPAMWSNKTPDLVCFTCPVKPTQYLDPYFVRKNKKELVGDVFVGSVGPEGGIGDSVRPDNRTSTPPPTPEHAKTGYSINLVLEEEVRYTYA